MEAKAVAGAVSVIQAYMFEGALCLEVPCAEYEVFETLPAALMFEGKVCGRQGWNSELGKAYYSSAKKIATAA